MRPLYSERQPDERAYPYSAPPKCLGIDPNSELRVLVCPFCLDEVVAGTILGAIAWGKPMPNTAPPTGSTSLDTPPARRYETRLCIKMRRGSTSSLQVYPCHTHKSLYKPPIYNKKIPYMTYLRHKIVKFLHRKTRLTLRQTEGEPYPGRFHTARAVSL
jgi:hypothetical protein